MGRVYGRDMTYSMPYRPSFHLQMAGLWEVEPRGGLDRQGAGLQLEAGASGFGSVEGVAATTC